MSADRYAVVGGGIAGASVAYHLSERTDAEVVVFERNADLLAETTARSGAFVGYWGDESPARLRMLRDGLALYNRFLDDPRTDLTYHRVGRLHVATTAAGADAIRESFESRRRALRDDEPPTEVRSTYVAGDEFAETLLTPGLASDEIAGALFSPDVGYVDPTAIAREFVARARENGVRFETSSPVEDVAVADGRATGPVVDGEHVPADATVCTAGPWTPRLLDGVGVDLPVRHSLGPVLVLDPERETRNSVPSFKHRETGYYVRQNVDGTVFVGHYPGAYDEMDGRHDPDAHDRVPDDLRAGARETLSRLFPRVADAPVRDEWVGVRSLTPDRDPIVGWTEVEDLSVAVFNASGVQLAPVAGRVIARQLVSGERTDYYPHVSVSRFEGYGDCTD